MINNTENANEKMNLLRRLGARFHNPKVCQRVAALALAGTMAFSTACNLSISISTKGTTPNKKDPVITDQNGDVITPDPNYAQYSEILQYVLASEYYDSIIQRGREDLDFYKSGAFQSHPYGFLEDEGYDVEAIKAGRINCYSSSYVLKDEPNNLYISTFIQTNSSTPYYDEYLLTYSLTDQEMKDYHSMHSGFYVQACFMNDAVSQFKDPIKVQHSRITVDAHKNLRNTLRKMKLAKQALNDNDIGDIHFLSFDEENGTFQVLLQTYSSQGKSMIASGYVNVANLVNGTKLVAANSDKAFYKPSKYDEFQFKESLNQNQPQQVILYQTYDVAYHQTSNFENE